MSPLRLYTPNSALDSASCLSSSKWIQSKCENARSGVGKGHCNIYSFGKYLDAHPVPGILLNQSVQQKTPTEFTFWDVSLPPVIFFPPKPSDHDFSYFHLILLFLFVSLFLTKKLVWTYYLCLSSAIWMKIADSFISF